MKTYIIFNGISLAVEGDYQEEEQEVWTTNDGEPGVPGSPASFYIKKIYHENKNIYNLFCEDYLTEIESIILNQLKNE